MDVEFIKDTSEVFLIELNAFGAEFSAASCLFHWLRDTVLAPLTATVSIQKLSFWALDCHIKTT